ncbi:MAG: hypothetical protein AAF402_12310 [Pseudomonadota bacterium]
MNIEDQFPDVRLTGKDEVERGHLVIARMYRIFVYLCDKHDIQWWAPEGWEWRHFEVKKFCHGVVISTSA